MIKKLILRDFQAHPKLALELDPHVNVVVGSTDAGKSAVIRALRWVCLNKPKGDAFVRHGTKRTRVTIYFDDHRVSRTRGGKTNTYHLDGTELVAFGNNVPDRISQLLKLSDLNFQLQHDTAFWFGESEGSVSKQLNQIVNLGSIDRKLAQCASLVRKHRAEISVIETRVQTKREVIAKCAGAKEYHASVYELVTLDQQLTHTRDQADALESALNNITTSRENITRLTKITEEGEVVVALGEALKATGDKADRLESAIRQAERLHTDANAPEIDFSGVEEAAKALTATRAKIRSLDDAITVIREDLAEGRELRDQLETLEKQLKEATPDVCPLCEQKIPHDHA